jgi:hypothetical protein
VPEIQKVLIAAKQKKALDSLVIVYRSDINILQGKINLLEEKDRNSIQIATAYQSQVDILNKEVKKWKRKTRWTAVGGVLLTGLVTTLFIIK